MKFVKVNKDTLRCLISEEEMTGFGIEVEELISNRDKAQDFLQMVLADAEEETGFRIDETSISVEATLLPGRGISLTISASNYSNDISDKLRRFHEAVKDYTKIQEEILHGQEPSEQTVNSMLIYTASSLEEMEKFSCLLQIEEVKSSLYKVENQHCYYLILEKEFNGDEMRQLGAVGLEFAKEMILDKNVKNYVQEHGTCIVGSQALELLNSL
ncbi:MAG: adaptor protein MecA [Eubacterium sp.]|jgi:Negative regulator of genetic competence, sporulation and motility|nr:adaptor protein MecA [Eubacterium sp.]